jgi:hypothetical protein
MGSLTKDPIQGPDWYESLKKDPILYEDVQADMKI